MLRSVGRHARSVPAAYIGKSDTALRNHFKTLVFTGKGSQPRAFATNAEMLNYVMTTKGAIGYVSADGGYRRRQEDSTSSKTAIRALEHCREDLAEYRCVRRRDVDLLERVASRSSVRAEARLRLTNDALFPAAQSGQEAEAAFERMAKGFHEALHARRSTALDQAEKDGAAAAAALQAAAACPDLGAGTGEVAGGAGVRGLRPRARAQRRLYRRCSGSVAT